MFSTTSTHTITTRGLCIDMSDSTQFIASFCLGHTTARRKHRPFQSGARSNRRTVISHTHRQKWWICCVRVVKTAIMLSCMCTKENPWLCSATQPNIMASSYWERNKRIRRSSKWACFTIMCQGCSRSHSLSCSERCH